MKIELEQVEMKFGFQTGIVVVVVVVVVAILPLLQDHLMQQEVEDPGKRMNHLQAVAAVQMPAESIQTSSIDFPFHLCASCEHPIDWFHQSSGDLLFQCPRAFQV